MIDVGGSNLPKAISSKSGAKLGKLYKNKGLPLKIEDALNEIENVLRNEDKAEIPSKLIGELVIKKLKKLDKVAYIRFASIYKDFEDVKDFEKEIKSIK